MVFAIYNKPSIFELQTIITHPILWDILKSYQGTPKKTALLVKGMGLGLKIYIQLHIWTLGSSTESGEQWKPQIGQGKAKE